MIRPNLLALASLVFLSASLPAAEDRRERVLADRRDVAADARWIYNDLPKALALAAESRKPLLVVLRCVP
jgi:hypothetical protein